MAAEPVLAGQVKMTPLVDNKQVLGKIGASAGSGPTSPKGRKPWRNVSLIDFDFDDGLLVTAINQTHDLLRLKNSSVLFSGLKATDGWVQAFGLENMHLTLEDLVKKGNIVLNAFGETEQIEFTKETIQEFEYDLCAAIELYDKRIQWLLRGSRKMFGIIQGAKVGVLVDASEVSIGPRLTDYKRDLLSLIDEQLCYMKHLYFLSFGTEVSTLWQQPKAISVNVLREARQWVKDLKPNGSCNLLKALKKILPLIHLDTLLIIVGSCPDQSADVLSDYIQHWMPGRKLLLHTVAYECTSQVPAATLRSLVDVVGGRYHVCTSKDKFYDSSDICLVRFERQKAEDMLNIVNDIYMGRMGDHLFSLMKTRSEERVASFTTKYLPRPPNHEGPLVIKSSHCFVKTSAEWLKMNGLKAKKLNLYQVLAPNAFSLVEEFVPILQKTVSSTLHEKAMMQFEWHDGTVKNIHVDLPILYDYQKQLGRMVKAYEKRIEWLSTASRKIWGTVWERRVAILIDISFNNASYIIHLQHSMRLLLEEQLSSKEAFNIIAFGSHVKAWQPQMVSPQPDNLQSAWRWVLGLHCEGTRNVMDVLRRAVEVDFKDKDEYESQGIYLLTTGVPDQEMHAICSYMTEVCGGCDLHLHICLFSADTPTMEENIPPRYASPRDTAIMFKEITQAVSGRFHWFGEKGIYESDDIRLIASEVEKAVNYSHKCAVLVESLKQPTEAAVPPAPEEEEKEKEKEKKEKIRPQKLPPPKPTALTLARLSHREKDPGHRGITKPFTWRPTSAKAGIPPEIPSAHRGSRRRITKVWKPAESSVSSSYTEKGSGSKKGASPKISKRTIPDVVLPEEEERCSSKEWLNKCSIKKLKLDLPSLIFGPEFIQQRQRGGSLQKKVSTRYCDIFPTLEMDGIEKHLQVPPQDLELYIEQMEKVLRCYAHRLRWLLSGSRRLFGVILEDDVCILIDTSGSMEPSLEEVTKELTSLIWDQLRKYNVRFNLISFADSIRVWQEGLMDATDKACHEAVQWASTFRAHGNTSILEALRKAASFKGVEGLYVLSDGKPDTSRRLVIQEMEMLVKRQDIKIHTISFNCSDREANDFLRKLASRTNGRYHRCHGASEGQWAVHKMLTDGFKDDEDPVLPRFEGDDLKQLAEEIAKARTYLKQARLFRSALEKKNCEQKDSGIS